MFQPIDGVILGIFFSLVFIGLAAIFTSQYESGPWNLLDMGTNYGKQILWIGVSMSLFLIIQLTDARIFSAMTYIIYGLVMLLLMVVFVKGQTVAGNQNWIDFGFFKLQPSEFAKYGTALALAHYLSRPLTKFPKD